MNITNTTLAEEATITNPDGTEIKAPENRVDLTVDPAIANVCESCE